MERGREPCVKIDVVAKAPHSLPSVLRGELTFCFKAVLTRVGFRLHQDLQIVGKGLMMQPQAFIVFAGCMSPCNIYVYNIGENPTRHECGAP